MRYKIYECYINSRTLLIGAVCEKSNALDALEKNISVCMTLSPRIAYLYNSTLENHPLPEQIVNILTHEDKLSILELKKNKIRITFFIDYDGVCFSDKYTEKTKAIVFLTYFKKEQKTAPIKEIKKLKGLEIFIFKPKLIKFYK